MLVIERGTTQEIKITIKGWDLSVCSNVRVTFKQDTGAFLTRNTFTSIEFANNSSVIKLELSQRETLMFKGNRTGKVQVRWLDANGKARKTKTAEFTADECLDDAILEGAAVDNG